VETKITGGKLAPSFAIPGDPRYPDALARGLRSAGYRFREGPLEGVEGQKQRVAKEEE